MTVLFEFLLEQYVDDFPELAPEQLSHDGIQATDVIELLGWEVKREEGALPIYGTHFDALGVRFLLEGSARGEVEVTQKPGQAERVRDLVQQLLNSHPPSRATAETLRGILGFARAQCFGRCGAASLHYLGELIAGRQSNTTGVGTELLSFWPDYLERAAPRKVIARDSRKPILLFTDGAEEGVDPHVEVSIGGVLVDPEATDTRDLTPKGPTTHLQKNCRTGGRRAFGGKVPGDVVESWRAAAGTTRVIHQAELYPILVATRLWRERLAGRRVLVFVDNEPARAALIKGATSALASARIVGEIWKNLAEIEAHIWVERVPSRSNPADGPSRDDWTWLEERGFLTDPTPSLVDYRVGRKSSQATS